jgi:hypothetical protein
MEENKNGGRKPLKMRYIKIAVPPKIHKQLRMIAAETESNVSHLVCEILYQYLMMPGAQVPAVKIPTRLAEQKADEAIRRAMQADEQELGMKDPTPTRR